MLIIGLCGKMGSGKDYIADNYIVPVLNKENLKGIKFCFADFLKMSCVIKHKTSFNDVYYNKPENVRTLMQTTGTQKRHKNPEYFINQMNFWLNVFKMRKLDYVIISDIRYQNEFEFVKSQEKNFIIKINSPLRNKNYTQKYSNENIQFHSSEIEINNFNADLIINNDDNDNNEQQLTQIVYSSIYNKFFI